MRHMLLFVLSISLMGCLDEEDNPLATLTSDRDKLIGTWYLNADDIAALTQQEEDLMGLEAYETSFADDGTYTERVTIVGITIELKGTWTLDGNKLTQVQDGDTYMYTVVITDAALTLTDDEGVTIIMRKKNG
jgi:hypothetical protein